MVSSTTQKQDLNDDIASKLLCLAHLMLASGSLDVTLPMAAEFFTSTITTLMIYSTEGIHSSSNGFCIWIVVTCPFVLVIALASHVNNAAEWFV